MKCPNCKTEMEISNGVATCPKCGARYRVKESDEERQVAKPQTVQAYETTVPEKPKTNDLADIKRRLAAADEVQDLKIRIAEMEEKQAKLESDLAKAKRASQSSGAVGIGKSGFTATVSELFSEKLLLMWVSLVTLGIAYPWLKCHYESFKASKTYIKGRRLVFVGKGGELAKKYFLWAFLSVITFGIFSIIVSDKMHKWVVEHTHYDGNESAESSYDGKVGAKFGFKILGFLAGVFTFGLAKTFVICKREKYFANHTLINGAPIYFDGTGFGLLKKQALWGALTVATFGVFALWKDQQRRQWICSNLSNDYADDVSADSETPEEERARIEEEKRRKEELAQQKALKKQQRKEIRKLPAWKASTALFVIGTILLVPLIPFMVFSFVYSPYYPEVKILVTCLIVCSAAIIALMAGSIACSKKIKRKGLAIAAIVIIVISAGAMGGGFYGVSEIAKYSNVDPYYYIMQEDGTYAISLQYNEESGIEEHGDMHWAKEYKQKSLGENIVIPSSYQGVTVTAIADNGFNVYSSISSKIKSITIPDTIKKIGRGAFSGLHNLTAVHITDLEKWCEISFGEGTSNPLYYAHDLYVNGKKPGGDVVLTKGTAIPDYTFYNCTDLTSITIPDSVTSIGDYAFSGCTGLMSVTIPDSVTSIGEHAFDGCTGLTTVKISDNVTKIGDYAFLNCPVESATMPASAIKSVPKDYLTSVTITSGDIPYRAFLTRIDSDTYRTCTSLTNVIIGDNVTSIGDEAFDGCTGLVSVTIGSGVTNIGYSAFNGCYRLIEVYNKSSLNIATGSTNNGYVGYYAKNVYTRAGGSKLSTDENGFVIYKDGDDKILVAYQGNATDVVLPDGITEINQYAFWGLGITSITIPDSVTSIGKSAFEYCQDLTNVTIGSSVTSIGDDAFYECIRLIEVYNKSSLNITAGSTNNGYVGYYAKNVYTADGGSRLSTDENGFVIYKDGADKILVVYQGTATDVVLPDGITEIYQYAFAYCTDITSIVITDNVKSIGDAAFGYCTSLTTVTIPDNVTSIGRYAFRGCESLASVVIPDKVTRIREYTFYECGELTNVTIGNGVTAIGENAFERCTSLTSIIIPDSVTSIGRYAFRDCTGLTSVTIGSGVKSIADSVFDGSSELTSITYNGTIEQWKAIYKWQDWNSNTGDYVVHCTDGDISKANS